MWLAVQIHTTAQTPLIVYNSGTVGRASDLQFTGREFESWLGTIA